MKLLAAAFRGWPRLAAAVAAALLAWVLFASPTPERYAERRTRDTFEPNALDLTYEVRPAAGSPTGDARGAAFAPDPIAAAVTRGTFIAGDAFVGQLVSSPFRLTHPALWIPVRGYPVTAGRLVLVVAGDAGQPATEITFNGPDPAEAFAFWRVDVSSWLNHEARLRLEDTRDGLAGWLAVGPLLPAAAEAPEPRPYWLDTRAYNYGFFFAIGGAVLALVWIPGCCLAAFTVRWGHDIVTRPLPGLLLLTLAGWACWLNLPGTDLVGLALLTLNLVGAVALIIRPPRPTPGHRPPLLMHAALVVLAAVVSAMPLPVAQEYGRGSAVASRMVASSGDNTIPFATAAYLSRGYDGIEHSNAYFGPEWSLTSRGPLVPFALVALFRSFRLQTPEPLGPDILLWPAGAEGFFLSRWLGMMTNGFVVFGCWRLARTLGTRISAAATLPWLVVAPFAVSNVAFLWPKLLAAYFILLAIAETLHQQSIWRIAAWAALAYYSHPVGALLLPAVATFFWRLRAETLTHPFGDWRKATRATTGLTLLVLLALGPWLWFKAGLGHEDAFLRHPLGAGRGHDLAGNFGEWWRVRWDNLRYTLMPGLFFWSDHMTAWVEGPLTASQRWVVSYAKTLPGHLGHVGFLVAVVGWWYGVRKRRDLTLLAGWWMVPAWICLLVFSGYSPDGLGRYSLEPMGAIVLAGAFVSRANPRLLPVVLVLAAAEAALTVALGFTTETGFGWSRMTWPIVGLALLALAIYGGTVAAGAHWLRQHARGG